jgi:hypothetical protein
MPLRIARLCLDCENVHEAQQCPVCASETFAFLTRWVPAPERRHSARVLSAGSAQARMYRRLLTADALRPKFLVLLKRGALGFGLVSVARSLWRWRHPPVAAA